MPDLPSSGAKKNLSPALTVLLILVALGVIIGIMWSQSEAPLVNRLPKLQPMNMPGPSPVEAKQKSNVLPAPKPPHTAVGESKVEGK